MDDLGVFQDVLRVKCDNLSAIFLAKNHTFHERTKHIDVRFHFVREILEECAIQVEKVDTKDNPADMLTKVVSGIKLHHCKSLINMLLV